ncbi:hypothetical protein V8C34DRAFT_295374 [Trichoderma compactum]
MTTNVPPRMCSEVNNYYGFFSEASGKYQGHNGYGEIRASAETMLDWEYFTVRWHDNRGYRLLIPYWHYQSWSVDVAEDGRTMQKRIDGSTLWQFVKVSEESENRKIRIQVHNPYLVHTHTVL